MIAERSYVAVLNNTDTSSLIKCLVICSKLVLSFVVFSSNELLIPQTATRWS